MSVSALTGNDTVMLQGRVFTDFGDGDIATIAFPNDTWEVVAGKNGNSVYAYNNKGDQAELELKLIRGSNDDAFLSRYANISRIDPPSTVLMVGQIAKRMGNGLGMVNNDRYLCEGGVIARTPDGNTSSDGKTDDGQVVYKIKFARVTRVQ